MSKRVKAEEKAGSFAKEFEVVGVKPGVVLFHHQKVDLRTLNLVKARKLFEQGFKYLKRTDLNN